ncbi:MAG: dimethyladenosine transferase, rRNA (adenine1518-N6/adenine1519-N6)-dimethyltransferase [Candidatus Parcubacteria bacterium]|jgi:16S rRNA (adenine1518-N6/adenine1519-N6)-dimethyltransferase
MVFAKKSLGQNFLITPRIVEMIALAGEIKQGETVIEIGPGKGALTAELLKAGARVVAIEKDDRLIPILSDLFKKEIENKTLVLIHKDVMDISDEDLSLITSDETYKVIANIPYYITGQIIRTFLSRTHQPVTMILMVQKEVANRTIARDGKESILSLAVKIYATPSLVMNVSRGNFFPIPNVDSAVLKLSDIQNPFKDKITEDRFFAFVKSGFAQKRKKLISNLAAVETKENLRELFKKLSLDENIRAEDLTLTVWKKLAEK